MAEELGRALLSHLVGQFSALRLYDVSVSGTHTVDLRVISPLEMRVHYSLLMCCDRVLLVDKSPRRRFVPLFSFIPVCLDYVVFDDVICGVSPSSFVLEHLFHQLFKFVLDSLRLFLQFLVSNLTFPPFVVKDKFDFVHRSLGGKGSVSSAD